MKRTPMPPLRQVIVLADNLAAEHDRLDDDDLDGLTQTLALLLDAQAALGSIRDRLEREVLKRMADKQHVTESGYTVERHGARQRVKWDNARLTWLVAQRAREDRVIDTETGEAEPIEDAVTRGLVDAYGLDTASKAPRTSWLKAHDLDPDDFRDFEWGPPRLQLHRPEKKGDAA